MPRIILELAVIGFMLDDLSQSQIYCDLVRSHDPLVPVTAYVRRTAPAWLDPPFPVDSWCAAWGASFPVVATNLDSLARLAGFPRVPRLFYFAADLEWLRHARWGGPPPYHELARLYRNERLTIVCRSASHQRAIAEAFNVDPPHVCGTLSASFFAGLLK